MTLEFPTTRYVGSKLKIINWIWDKIKEINFETYLDAFGGMASVSYLLKKKSKKIIFNDILKSRARENSRARGNREDGY
jgi:adenine-specific DNA-methyltransferase